MTPLPLHTKTTLVVSAVIVLSFAAIGYLYDSAVERIALRERATRAELLVSQIADRIGRQRLITSTSALEADLELIRHLHPELALSAVGVYELDQGRLSLVLTLPEDSHASFPAPILEASARGEASSITQRIDASHAAIYASAPILDRSLRLGFIVVRFETTRENLPLVGTLRWVTVIAVVVALFVVTTATYLLFRYRIYRPLDTLLSVMTQAQSGNLEVTAPEGVPDEIGQLSRDFNAMLTTIRRMSEERELQNVQLQERVAEATTELAERNQQLEMANQHLFEMQRELTQLERFATAGQMAAQFAHEVGTPLNLISGHVQLLRSKMSDPKFIERLDVMSSQIDRITRIVRGMLDATRRPASVLKSLDVNKVLEETIAATIPTLQSRGVHLVSRLAHDLPAVLGDEDQLQQIFLNLIDNSVDAMPGGGTLTFSTEGENGSVVIECEDTGEGMTEEVKRHMFDPLYTTKAKGHGSGLGLAIVQQIVKEHRGRVEVESEPARGARMRIVFPANGAPNA